MTTYCRFTFLCAISLFTRAYSAEFDTIQLIQQRYYLIKRLQKAVDTLTSSYTYKKKIKGDARSLVKHIPQMKHAACKKTLTDMIQKKTMAPFYTLWNDVLSYKYIASKDLVRELLTIILLLYKDLIASTQKYQTGPESVRQIKNIDAFLEETSDHSDPSRALSLTQTIYTYYKSIDQDKDKELASILTTPHTVPAVHPAAGRQTVEQHLTDVHNLLDPNTLTCDMATVNSMRFYYIQRLLKSMFLLSLKQRDMSICLTDDAISSLFTCSWVKNYMKQVLQEKNFDPLFRAWSQVTTYDFIDDDFKMKEFIASTYVIYYCRVHHGKLGTERERRNDLLLMYDTLSTLPIPELLDLLDDVVEQYDILAAEYALKDSSLSWTQWLKKYWWTTPLMAGSLGLTLLQHRKLLVWLLSK